MATALAVLCACPAAGAGEPVRYAIDPVHTRVLFEIDHAGFSKAIGTVSVGAVASSPMDMHEMLNKKAEEQGASSYRIIEARTGDHWHATAELYK